MSRCFGRVDGPWRQTGEGSSSQTTSVVTKINLTTPTHFSLCQTTKNPHTQQDI